MELPTSKHYTPRKDGRYYAYRFPAAWMTDNCTVDINVNSATITSGGNTRLVIEGFGRYVYFRMADGLLPNTRYRADRYSDKIVLTWGDK